MKECIGLDIGGGAVKIAFFKKNKIHRTQIIEADNKDIKSIAYQVRQFFRKNRIKPKTVNVLIKDYKTRRTKVERISSFELKTALQYEREEKIGTTDMLGDNYKDSHIIQKRNNKTLDILLTVINQDEIKRIEDLLEALKIPDVNIYMECFLYNDTVGDDAVIVDIGYSSIQIMFFDKRKVVKTSLLKKGIKDILADLRDKVDGSVSFENLKVFSFEDKKDEKYDAVISWFALFADNITNSIGTYARENMKSVSGMKIYYTGGLFAIPRTVEYFNYLMELEGRLLKISSQKEDPVLNNSIALAYKTGTKGRVNKKYGSISGAVSNFVSYIALLAAAVLLVFGGYNAYRYYDLQNAGRVVQDVYEQTKKSYKPVVLNYVQLDNLLEGGAGKVQGYTETADLGEKLIDIKNCMNPNISIKNLNYLSDKNTILIEGNTSDYTNLGIFTAQLKKMFKKVDLTQISRKDEKSVEYRLECIF